MKNVNIMYLKESSTVELKKSIAQLDDALKTICAFLNHKGGTVYFGIDSTGKILGTQVSEKTLRKISQQICSRIKPETIPEIREIIEKEKSFIEVKIPEGTNKPYFLDGKVYKKVGSEKRIIPPDELKRIILEQKRNRWDEEICKKATIKDIDEDKVKWFLKVARVERNLAIPEKTSLKVVLTKLNLLKDEKLTNAAVLLFGTNPQQFFIQAKVKGIRFVGKEPVKPFLDMKLFEGNIIDQIDSVKTFVLEHIPKAVWLAGNIQREERYDYPPDAIREGIVNAICHRDYESIGETHIRIFDDRIEIWNPGELPKPLKLEDLKREHKSIPRNPLIAEQLFWIKYIEKVGSGTNDMIKFCAKWGIPEPEFKHVTGDFVVIFRGQLTEEYLKDLGLNKRQIKTVIRLKRGDEIDNKTYREINKIGKVTAAKELNDLVAKKILKITGAGRATKYYLNE